MVSRGNNGPACWVLLGLLALPTASRAEMYKWVDAQGVVHFTDDPFALPEPQRSRALKKLQDKQDRQSGSRATTRPSTSSSGEYEPIPTEAYEEKLPAGPDLKPIPRKEQEATWRKKADAARQQVEKLEKQCQEQEGKRDRANRDSLLFARPGDRKNASDSRTALEKCQRELEQARRYLDEELPEQARRAGVPPGWLR